MSSVAARLEGARDRHHVRAALRVLDSIALSTSAVSLCTAFFVLRATSTRYEFPFNQAALVAFVALIQWTPVLVLCAVDLAMDHRPVWRRRFRAVLFGVPPAYLLVHALGRLIDGGAYVDDLETRLLFSIGACAVLAAGVAIAGRYAAAVGTLYRYLLPAAVAPAVLILVGNQPPSVSTTALATPAVADPLPTTFVLVFDELSYEALLDEGSSIDAGRYPHLAAFAEGSALFTDASARHFRSKAAVPELIGAPAALSELAGVHLYLQYGGSEEPFRAGCGLRYRCAGASSFSAEEPRAVFTHFLMAYTWRATPGPLRGAVEGPREWLANALGQPQAAFDWRGTHLFSEATFNAFLEDVRHAEDSGQVFVLHSMLSHFAYIYDRDGELHGGANLDFWTPNVDREATYENMRRHLEYTDARFGEFIDALRASGHLDDAVIVVTADHGLRRGDVLEDEAPKTLPLEVTSVPLLVRGPGIEPGAYDVAYSHDDFEATLHDVLGLPAPGSGVSAFDRSVEDAVVREFVVDSWEDGGPEWHYERAPGDDLWRLVRIENASPGR